MAFLWKHPDSRFWIARFYDQEGKRRNRSTKIEAKEKNRRQALKIAEAFEEAANKRKTARQVRQVILDLHQEITGEQLASATVREQVEKWLGRKKAVVQPSTFAFYRSATNNFLTFLREKADQDIGEISRDDISSFRDREANRVSAKTANHGLKCIRMFFKDAMRDKLIPEDPTEFVECVKGGAKTELRPFTLKELGAIVAVADTEWKSMVYFGLYTGQRIGDIANLTWQNIDLVRSEVRLVTAKTGRRQIIPMALPLKEHIESLPAGDNPAAPLHERAFGIMERQGKSGSLSNQFADVLAQAGLREKTSHRSKGKGRGARRDRNPLSFHSLRRTATTLLHEAGVPAAVAQELIGHDSEAIHEVYVAIGDEALKQAANAFPEL
ncbi:site-specific integrase [Verrucomicrobiales bacterium]|nr:site-specific integrase [Verrucomicrobiales bacterium]